MLKRIANLALHKPRHVLLVAIMLFFVACIFGLPAAKSLSGGGSRDPNSESAHAGKILADKFGQSDQQMLIIVSSPAGIDTDQSRAAGLAIVDELQRSPFVYNVSSPWTTPPRVAAKLISKKRDSGMIVANLKGGENNAQRYAKSLYDEVIHERAGVSVRAGGVAVGYSQANSQNERDLQLMESIALPLSLLVMIWVFGGLVAASLPIALGVFAMVGSLAVLRLIAMVTDVSMFALNLTTAMALALAIDYTLLIISRYRDEVAEGTPRNQALVRTVCTAGRTVMFSATTVALSMAVMVIFPLYSLKSYAYAGVATVAFVAVESVVVTPALIVLLGPQLDALDARRITRRLFHRPDRPHKLVVQTWWYRWSKFVTRHALLFGLSVAGGLMLLAWPFLGVKWGFADDRILPQSSSAHRVGDELRNNFADDAATAIPIVISGVNNLTPAEFAQYGAQLSEVPDVSSVSTPVGTFASGAKTGPATAPTGITEGNAFLTVESVAPLFSKASNVQLDRLHSTTAPSGHRVQLAGQAQINRDSVHGVIARLPTALAFIAGIALVLLFLLTGSIVLPPKALLLNILSLTAAFGALVWIFQEGHLNALGTTASGTLVADVPVLLFCIAFGLSMDYEVFLISRIREYWLNSACSNADNDESIALGLARTGRVVTAAALVMSISFAALAGANVSSTRMLGVGLVLAVLADATLVRIILVPAFMHLLGQWNWWAPPPLRRLHDRFGISEHRPAARVQSTLSAGEPS